MTAEKNKQQTNKQTNKQETVTRSRLAKPETAPQIELRLSMNLYKAFIWS